MLTVSTDGEVVLRNVNTHKEIAQTEKTFLKKRSNFELKKKEDINIASSNKLLESESISKVF